MTSSKIQKRTDSKESNDGAEARLSLVIRLNEQSDSDTQDHPTDAEGQEVMAQRRLILHSWFENLNESVPKLHREDAIATVFGIPWKDTERDPIWVTSLSNKQVLDTDDGSMVICKTAGPASTLTDREGQIALWWKTDYPNGSFPWTGVSSNYTCKTISGTKPPAEEASNETFTRKLLESYRKTMNDFGSSIPGSVETQFQKVMDHHHDLLGELVCTKIYDHLESSSEIFVQRTELHGDPVIIRHINVPMTDKTSDSDKAEPSQDTCPPEVNDDVSMADTEGAKDQ